MHIAQALGADHTAHPGTALLVHLLGVREVRRSPHGVLIRVDWGVRTGVAQPAPLPPPRTPFGMVADGRWSTQALACLQRSPTHDPRPRSIGLPPNGPVLVLGLIFEFSPGPQASVLPWDEVALVRAWALAWAALSASARGALGGPSTGSLGVGSLGRTASTCNPAARRPATGWPATGRPATGCAAVPQKRRPCLVLWRLGATGTEPGPPMALQGSRAFMGLAGFKGVHGPCDVLPAWLPSSGHPPGMLPAARNAA